MKVGSHSVEEILPVVGLAGTVLYPGMQCTLLLATLKAFGAVREAQRSARRHLVAICGATETNPSQQSLVFGTGVLAEVIDLSAHTSGLWLSELRTQGRVSIGQLLREQPFRLARVSPVADDAESEAELEALVTEIQLRLVELKKKAPCCTVATTALKALALARDTDTRVSSLMSCLHLLPLNQQQDLLECSRRSERLNAARYALENRIQTYPRADQAPV